MFKPPDTFHLAAAVGWLELGNPVEAMADLEKISPPQRGSPEVLSVRLSIYQTQNRWQEADVIARVLIEARPVEPAYWTALAYAVRRKPGGSIVEAKEILRKAAELFPRESLIFYNLACYEAQLGNLASAKDWLEKSYLIGDREELRRMAAKDPDLVLLRHFLTF